MEAGRAVSGTSLYRTDNYTWRLVLTTAGSILGAIAPGIFGAGPVATLMGTILVGLVSAFLTCGVPATRARALTALALTLVAVILTISGFTLADILRGRSVLGDRQFTFPVPSSPRVEDIAVSAPKSSSPTSPPAADPTSPVNSNPTSTRPLDLPLDPTPLPTPTRVNPSPTPPLTTPPTTTALLPADTMTTPSTTVITTGPDEEVIAEAPVELRAEPGQESVEIDWWRSVDDGSGDLQMDDNRIFTLLGAKLSAIDDSPTPHRASCAQVQNWTTEISFASLHIGSQLCAQSRGSRYAMLQVRAVPTSEASQGRFIFYGRTWALRFSP